MNYEVSKLANVRGVTILAPSPGFNCCQMKSVYTVVIMEKENGINMTCLFVYIS